MDKIVPRGQYRVKLRRSVYLNMYALYWTCVEKLNIFLNIGIAYYDIDRYFARAIQPKRKNNFERMLDAVGGSRQKYIHVQVS